LLLLATATACAGLKSTSAEIFDVPTLSVGGRSAAIDFAHTPDGPLVQLRARRSYYFTSLAIHPWFLFWDPSTAQWEQWEVWRWREDRPSERRRETLLVSSGGEPARSGVWIERRHGHVRQRVGVSDLGGRRPEVVLGEWRGDEATRLMELLRRPQDYPHRDSYRMWPGPNSNTYTRWVLSSAGLAHDAHPMAVGKDYVGLGGVGIDFSPTGTGLQVEALMLGVTLGLADGIELHFFGMTVGIDLWPPALKLPTGRYGFQE
jgi:hypothetical protein